MVVAEAAAKVAVFIASTADGRRTARIGALLAEDLFEDFGLPEPRDHSNGSVKGV
jgi:hypothetical protein